MLGQIINGLNEKGMAPFFHEDGFVLFHEDSLELLPKVPAESCAMIFADPPYLLSNGGFTVHAGKRVSVNKGEWDQSQGFREDFRFQRQWIKLCRPLLKPDGTIWISGTYHSIYQCGFALQLENYHLLNDICWYKPNGSPNLSCRYFTASHETLIWARKKEKSKHHFDYQLMKEGFWKDDFLKKPGKQMRSVWAISTPKNGEKKFGRHPTQKPEALLTRIILASTRRGDLVLDPFTGSSTTGIIACRHGRQFIGVDKDIQSLELSVRRFKSLQKQLQSQLNL